MMMSQESEVHRSTTSSDDVVVVPIQRCFTSIQLRQFSTTSTSQPQFRHVRLCPSMDLIAYDSSIVSSSTTSSLSVSTPSTPSSMVLHIHRTLNWQCIASTNVNTTTTTTGSMIPKDDLEHTNPELNSNDHITNLEKISHTNNTRISNDIGADSHQQRIEWSPDGRCIAVAIHRTVYIYSVEGLLLWQYSSSSQQFTLSTEHHHHPTSFLDPTTGNDGVVATDDSIDVNNSSNPGKVFEFTLPMKSVDTNNKDHNIQNTIPGSSHRTGTTGTNDIILSLSWVHLGSWCEHYLWPTTSTYDKNNDDDNYTYNDQQHLQQQYFPSYMMDYHQRSKHVLPPSLYHSHFNDGNSSHGVDNDVVGLSPTMNDTNHTTSKSMSLLCVLTVSGHLSIYLHGRYPIVLNISQLSLPSSNLPSSNHIFHPITASPDLTHFITTTMAASSQTQQDSRNSTLCNKIIINSFPALAQHRQNYGMIASLYGQTLHHIDTIRNSITEIVATWKSAFKPLDLKLDGLQKLLINYGLIESTKPIGGDHDPTDTLPTNKFKNSNSTRSLLIQYILSGHTTQNSGTTLSNAIDQFFTSVPMNDQLVQRMGVTMFNTLATIESTVRKLLVAPAVALVYVINQLYGLSAYRTDLFFVPSGTITSDANTPSTTQGLQLLHVAQQLMVTVNMTLTTLIEARSRIRTLVAWLRSTGATIKARGTATNSVQRENAKKRRISESVIRQLLLYLQESNVQNENAGSGGYVGLTETILNLRFADFLSDMVIHKENVPPPSDDSIADQHEMQNDINSSLASTSVPLALQITSRLADVVFKLPRSLLLQSMRQTIIQLPSQWKDYTSKSTHKKCLAITTRMGQGGINPNIVPFGDKPPSGFFSPTVQPFQNDPLSSASVNVRQWLIAAQSQSNSIQIHAFPLTWTNTGDNEFLDCDDNDDDSDMIDALHSKSKWSVALHVPDECTVRDIAFYSDDGKSTLSSSSYDNLIQANPPTGVGGQQEGRQSIGLLISRRQSIVTSVNDESVELWLLPYDDMKYTYESLQGSHSIDESTIAMYQCCSESFSEQNPSYYKVLPMTTEEPRNDVDNVIESDSDNVLYARTRKIFDAVDFTSSSNKCHFVLSGSRGIGAVIWNHDDGTTTTTSLEILDVEEEDDDDDDEDDNEAENMDDEA